MARELFDVCESIDANLGIGAVVVRGEGPMFCAGAHRDLLANASRDPAAQQAYDQLGWVYRSFTRVAELEAPTIAAVRGGAVGGGLNLVLATDLRIIATDARLDPGFLRLGLHPGGGYFVLTGRLAGRETAAAMGLFGESVTGTRAAEIGLAWQALPAEEVEGRALELARRAARDPELARLTAQSLRTELGPPMIPWPAALTAERAVQMWSLRRLSNSGD